MDLFTHFKLLEYLQLLPIGLIGLLAGVLKYFSDTNTSLRRACVIVATSSFICLCVFSLLSATTLPYLARVGLSASVGYFGIDKAIDLVKNILSLRKQ